MAQQAPDLTQIAVGGDVNLGAGGDYIKNADGTFTPVSKTKPQIQTGSPLDTSGNPLIPTDTSASGVTTAPATPPVDTSATPAPTPANNAPATIPGAPTGPAPTPPDLVGTYNDLRNSTSLPDLQNQLLALNAEQTQINSDVSTDKLTEPVGESEGFATSRLSEAQVNANARLDHLAIQQTLIQGKIANANTYINEVMSLTGQDYTNATNYYQNTLNNAIATQSAYTAQADKEQTAAAAYLSAVQTMFTNSGKTWSDISPAMKASIQLQEQKAGWTPGTLEAFSLSKPKAQLIASVPGIDPNTGANTMTLIYQDPETGLPGMIKTINTQGGSSSGTTGGYNTATGNNPLNLTLGSSTQKYVDNGDATTATANGQTFLVFKDAATGQQAAQDMLFNPRGQYANLTVDAAMKLWSNSGYDGSIVSGTDVDPNAKIGDLTSEEQSTLIQKMATAEGGKVTSGGATGTTGSPSINASTPGYTSTIVAGGLTQAAIDQAALQYATTGQMPSIGLGSTGAAMAKRNAIMNRAGELAPGGNIAVNKAEVTANSAALTTQVQYLNTTQRALTNAAAGLTQLTTAFQGKINNQTMPLANIFANAANYQLDPGNVAAYKAALAEVGNEYSQVFSRGGQNSVESHYQAQDIIDGNISVADLVKVGAELQAQGKIVINGAQQQISTIQGQLNSILSGSTGQYAPGTIITNAQGQIATVNADGTVTPLQ